ncbi:MAG: thiamine diphosphokinase [Oscillospiraceae bacterium]|nr:thiamine diphosphokinase [Oscillospiraceae bacterium]
MRPCWIFAGAPDDNFTVKPPDDAYIIAADSGYLAVKRSGLTPDLVLGDFDSLDEKPCCSEIITAPAEKDDTDTMLAVKTALERGYTDISIVGSIGGRLDHTFANIQTLAYILKNGGFGRLIGEKDTVELLDSGGYSYDRRESMYFSLFSYGESAVITTSGTKYNVAQYRLDNTFPLGVSNEITEDNCRISVHEGQILVIFSKK